MTQVRKIFWVFRSSLRVIKEAEQVIEMLVTHPSTARFISTKLARRFIADDPPQALIEKAAQTFINTKGDIKSVLRVILLDGLPLAQPKYKRPANFVLSSLPHVQRRNRCRCASRSFAPHGSALFQLAHARWLPRPQRSLAGQPHAALAICVRVDPQRDSKNTKHNLNSLLDALDLTGILQDDVDSITSLLLGAPLERSARDGLIDTSDQQVPPTKRLCRSSPRVLLLPLHFNGANMSCS